MSPAPDAVKPDAPPVPAAVNVTLVRPPGNVSVTVAEAASLGPVLPTTMVYVTGWPGFAVVRLSVLVIDRSTCPCTVAVVADELLPATRSGVPLLETVAVLEKLDPLALLAAMWSTRVNVALAPDASVEMKSFSVPVPPAGGNAALNVGPVFCVNDTKVAPLGTASESVTPWESLGPMFVTVSV